MLISNLQSEFLAKGYLHLEGFFSEAIMDTLQKEIIDHFGTDPALNHSEEFLDNAKVEVIPWFPKDEGSELFNLIDSDSRFKALTEATLGKEWQELYCMVMYSKPHSVGQAWHQDCPTEDPTKFNLNRLIYTENISESTGGEVVVVPGSHRFGKLTVGEPNEEMEEQVIVRPKKGDLILLHGHTWHRITPVKHRYRVSTNYRAIPKGTPLNITDICVYRNMMFDFSINEIIEHRT